LFGTDHVESDTESEIFRLEANDSPVRTTKLWQLNAPVKLVPTVKNALSSRAKMNETNGRFFTHRPKMETPQPIEDYCSSGSSTSASSVSVSLKSHPRACKAFKIHSATLLPAIKRSRFIDVENPNVTFRPADAKDRSGDAW
jgi:hypothetical protein